MSPKLPYEKLIAKKMQELRVPDAEASWQKMKRLLDSEMPLGDGVQKRPASGWWWKGGLIALISAGTGALIYSNARDVGLESVTTTEQTIDISKPAKPVTSIDQNFTPSATNADKMSASGPEGTKAHYNDFADVAPIKRVTAQKKDKNISTNGNRPPQENRPDTGPTNPNNNSANGFALWKNTAAIVPAQAFAANENKKPLTPGIVNDDPSSLNDNINQTTYESDSSSAITSGWQTAANDYFVMATVPNENISYSRQLPKRLHRLSVPETVWQLPDVTAQKKTILKELRRQQKKQERMLAKSYRNRQSFWGEQPDRWFAAGVAPYQNFSIGSQQTYNYNSAGSKNIAADYLPAPYLQLHVTNRMYVMSEFQFNAPQSIPSLLLSQKSLTVPMNTVGYTESTYLRKLYYFNMPVSFYYSPVKNFYLGSGLQFSSFNSGLAYTEQRAADNTIIKSDQVKIKDDSLSSKINASEWRYLFDANYYVNRFMFGIRYNQALNNFINSSVNNLLPVQARNQSVQFYIRYNIIMSDKRR